MSTRNFLNKNSNDTSKPPQESQYLIKTLSMPVDPSPNPSTNIYTSEKKSFILSLFGELQVFYYYGNFQNSRRHGYGEAYWKHTGKLFYKGEWCYNYPFSPAEKLFFYQKKNSDQILFEGLS